MAPIVHGLEDKYGEVLEFVYLDIDDPGTEPFQEALNYNRRWRPFIFLVTTDGEIIGDPFIGYTDGAVLDQAILDFLIGEGAIPAQ